MHVNSACAMEDNRHFSRVFASYKTFCKRLVLAQVILLVSGCSAFKGYPARATDPSSDLLQLQPDIEANQIAACLGAPTLACRNKIIAARMYAIDIQFSE